MAKKVVKKIVRAIDGKYGIREDFAIVNLVSGEEIPQEEPLILFRARDQFAADGAIVPYMHKCAVGMCNELHIAGLQQVLQRFYKFAASFPERLKQPGVTRHLALEGYETGNVAADGKSKERWVKAHGDGCRGGDCDCPLVRGYYAISEETPQRDPEDVEEI